MKNRTLILICLACFVTMHLIAQPGDPGSTGGGGGGTSIPLDRGLLLGLLAGGSALSAFLFKRKKKED